MPLQSGFPIEDAFIGDLPPDKHVILHSSEYYLIASTDLRVIQIKVCLLELSLDNSQVEWSNSGVITCLSENSLDVKTDFAPPKVSLLES